MISIVIPNFNSVELLKKNLPKLIGLLEKSKLDFEIIVSDDCSSDDSLSYLSSLRDVNNLKVLFSEKNVGFGANVDRGIRASVGEIVFVLNAIDLLPEKSDYFKLMLDHFKNKDVFSVGALKREKDDHGCGEIYFEKGFYLHRRKCVIPGLFTLSEVAGTRNLLKDKSFLAFTKKRSRLGGRDDTSDWADGGAQAIRKEYYEKIGGFDPKYFLYWEDVDLGFRAWKAGYKIVFEPKAVLIHQKNDGPIAKRFSQNEIRELNIKNQIYFTWKNSDLKHKLLFLLWLPYHLAISLKNHDWLFFKALTSF